MLESSYLSRYIHISVVLEVLLLKNIFSDYKLPRHGELLSYMGVLFTPQTGTKYKHKSSSNMIFSEQVLKKFAWFSTKKGNEKQLQKHAEIFRLTPKLI